MSGTAVVEDWQAVTETNARVEKVEGPEEQRVSRSALPWLVRAKSGLSRLRMNESNAYGVLAITKVNRGDVLSIEAH
jgi:hypothetical protein